MNNCAIIKDLLPLYVDDVASEASKKLVKDHLAHCENCKAAHDNMCSEVNKTNTTEAAQQGKINALKSMKTKMLRQKLLIGAAACALTVAIGIGINWFVFHNARPMEFSHWTKQVQVMENIAASETTVRLFSTTAFYGSRGITMRVNVDGVDTLVTFIYLTETLSTRMRRDADMQRSYINLATLREGRLQGLGENEAQPQAVEIFYLIAPFRNRINMTPEEFYAQRTNGQLLWRGVIGD